MYEWGTIEGSTRVPKSIDATTSVKFTNLPKGGTCIYMRAVDPSGAVAEERQHVEVVGPPPGAGP